MTQRPNRYAPKHSYSVTCSSQFRDAVLALAASRKVNVADLARSILLVLPQDAIMDYPDPGEPQVDDRDEITLKSGPSQGRPWRRKPRLQLRLPPGSSVPAIRRALAMAMAVDKGELDINLARPGEFVSTEEGKEENQVKSSAKGKIKGADKVLDKVPGKAPEKAGGKEQLQALHEENERLRTLVSVMAFELLPGGVESRTDALYILGFPPNVMPDLATIKARFRLHATIHHPDSDFGSHDRMSQLNAAMSFLQSGSR